MSKEFDKFKSSVRKADMRRNRAWLDTLERRKLDELKFHDAYRKRDVDSSPNDAQEASDTFEVLTGNLKYYKTTKRSEQFIENWFKANLKDKVFLDFACGDGAYAINALIKHQAKFSIGFDLSAESVENAEADALKAGVSGKTIFIQTDAEDTGLPAESFDVILCSGMLHHLDLKHAFPELERLLAPGGTIFCVEALDYNPLIKLYRNLTPGMRTEWEKAHILSMKDVKFAQKFFNLGSINYFHIFSPIAAHLPFLNGVFNTLDSILERVPFVNLMSWMFIFELKKK